MVASVPGQTIVRLNQPGSPFSFEVQAGTSEPIAKLLTGGDLANAELGFAGLAAQSGARSALARLWYVNDEDTLALMSGFYRQLSRQRVSIKAEAENCDSPIAIPQPDLSVENRVFSIL